MYFYKIKVSYDGTEYQGWQEQKSAKTIVGQLKQSFLRVFNKQISIVGASRTDAGVHAAAQIARVRTDLKIDPLILKKAWNGQLPNDINIISIEKCEPEFHPMKNVLQKTYLYNVYLERPTPFISRYGLYWYREIDLKKLEKCLKVFVGTHDFRSFSTGYEKACTVKTIDSIKLTHFPEDKTYQIQVKGKSFLHHMIRRIIGACLEISSRPNVKPEHLIEILKLKNPNQALPNAPAKGLMLHKIDYVPLD